MKKSPSSLNSRLLSGVFARASYVLLSIGLTILSKGQQTHDLPYTKDPANLPKALSNLQTGDYSGLDAELVARMGATQATPMLKEQFNRAKDAHTKAKLANALVRLKDPDDTYWNYLAARATEAINRGEPDPFRYDSNGKVVADRPSEAFEAWAKQHNLDSNTAFYQFVWEDISATMELATSKDQRAISLLRKALSSPITEVQATAASGLADLGDKDSIPLIIESCKRARTEAAGAIAESLVYFDDQSAQRAVDVYVPPQTAKILREAHAHGKTPFD